MNVRHPRADLKAVNGGSGRAAEVTPYSADPTMCDAVGCSAEVVAAGVYVLKYRSRSGRASPGGPTGSSSGIAPATPHSRPPPLESFLAPQAERQYVISKAPMARITDNMLPIDLQTPREIAQMLARRVKALRLERGWTQQEIADRSGVALATYRRFERSGRVSLERLVKLAVILDAQSAFDALFAPPPARSLSELEQHDARPTRERGRRRK